MHLTVRKKSFIKLSFLLSLSLLCGTFLPKLKTLVSLHEIVDQSLPSAAAYRKLKKDFELRNGLMVSFRPNNGWSNDSWDSYLAWKDKWQGHKNYTHSQFAPDEILKPEVTPGEIIYRRLLKENPRNLIEISETPWSNLLTDSKAESLNVQIQLEDAPGTKFGSFWPEAVAQLLDDLKTSAENLNPLVVGTSAFTYYSIKGVSHNLMINGVFLILLVFFFRFHFGTWRSGLVLLGIFVWAGTIIHGGMSMMGFHLEILSSGLFTIVIIASLEDYFYVCHQMARGMSFKDTIKEQWWPSFYTSLTTFLGFLSLWFTDVEILRRFGLWAAIGSMIEWAGVFILLPYFMEVCRWNTLVVSGKKTVSFWEKLSDKLEAIRPSKIVAMLLLSTYVIAFWLIPKLEVSGSPLDLFPKDHKLVTDFTEFAKRHGWEGEASIIFPLEVSESEQKNILRELKLHPNVAKIETLFDVRDYLSSQDTQGYNKALQIDFESHPFYGKYRGKYLSYQHVLYFKQTDLTAMQESIKTVRALCLGKCEMVGEIVSYAEFMSLVPQTLVKDLVYSVGTVALLIFGLAVYFKYPHPILFTLGSLWGSSTLIILMYLFGLKLNLLSCIFVSMMAGLTGDNGIQFLYAEHRLGRGEGIDHFKGCSLLMAVVMGASSLFFLFSYFAPPREFAVILMLGIFVSVFGDIWLTKALTQSHGPKN